LSLCGWAKANVLQLCRLEGGVAALLILLKRWQFFSFFLSVYVSTVGRHSITGNGLALGEGGDFHDKC